MISTREMMYIMHHSVTKECNKYLYPISVEYDCSTLKSLIRSNTCRRGTSSHIWSCYKNRFFYSSSVNLTFASPEHYQTCICIHGISDLICSVTWCACNHDNPCGRIWIKERWKDRTILKMKKHSNFTVYFITYCICNMYIRCDRWTVWSMKWSLTRRSMWYSFTCIW